MWITLLFAVLTAMPKPALTGMAAPAACDGRTIDLEPDGYVSGTQRFDGPEYIRGLHARGESPGAPVTVSVGPDAAPARFFLWALDSRLDGIEHYDRIAVSETGGGGGQHGVARRTRAGKNGAAADRLAGGHARRACTHPGPPRPSALHRECACGLGIYSVNVWCLSPRLRARWGILPMRHVASAVAWPR